LETLPSATTHEWRSASEVDIWGFTWVASRKGNEPWKQFHAVDLVRAGARGKPFWHAEAQAGPLWMQPQVIHRAREDGRITDEKDVRLWNLISCAGGATGILYPRWRPLLDGPLFGAFGAFGMDGSVTPRATMAGRVARWANGNSEICLSLRSMDATYNAIGLTPTSTALSQASSRLSYWSCSATMGSPAGAERGNEAGQKRYNREQQGDDAEGPRISRATP
jgi:hypothetical protein